MQEQALVYGVALKRAIGLNKLKTMERGVWDL